MIIQNFLNAMGKIIRQTAPNGEEQVQLPPNRLQRRAQSAIWRREVDHYFHSQYKRAWRLAHPTAGQLVAAPDYRWSGSGAKANG